MRRGGSGGDDLSDAGILRAAEVAAADCSGAAAKAKARDDESIFHALLEWQQRRRRHQHQHQHRHQHRHQNLRQRRRAKAAAAGCSSATATEQGAAATERTEETAATALCRRPMPG